MSVFTSVSILNVSLNNLPKGTSINDVLHFLAIFDLPTYLVLLYNVPFWGLSWTTLPILISDVINGRSRILVSITIISEESPNDAFNDKPKRIEEDCEVVSNHLQVGDSVRLTHVFLTNTSYLSITGQ